MLLRNGSPTSTSSSRRSTKVTTGGSVIDPKVVESLVDARSRSQPSPLEHLTPREMEVLSEIAQDKNNGGRLVVARARS